MDKDEDNLKALCTDIEFTDVRIGYVKNLQRHNKEDI